MIPTYHDTELLLLYYFGVGLEWAEDRVWTGPGSPEEGKIFVAPPAMRAFVNIFGPLVVVVVVVASL